MPITAPTQASGTLIVNQPSGPALEENWLTWTDGAIIRVFDSPLEAGIRPADLFDGLNSTGIARVSVVNCWDATSGATHPDFIQTLPANFF